MRHSTLPAAAALLALAAHGQSLQWQGLRSPLGEFRDTIGNVRTLDMCAKSLLYGTAKFAEGVELEGRPLARTPGASFAVEKAWCTDRGWLIRTRDSLGRVDAYQAQEWRLDQPDLLTPDIPGCCGGFASDYVNLWHFNAGKLHVRIGKSATWSPVPVRTGAIPVDAYAHDGTSAVQFEVGIKDEIAIGPTDNDGSGWAYLINRPYPGQLLRLVGYYGGTIFAVSEIGQASSSVQGASRSRLCLSADTGRKWDCPADLELDLPAYGSEFTLTNFGPYLFSLTATHPQGKPPAISFLHQLPSGPTRKLEGFSRCCAGNAGNLVGIDTAGILRVSLDRGATFKLFTRNFGGSAEILKCVQDKSGTYLYRKDAGWVAAYSVGSISKWKGDYPYWSQTAFPPNFDVTSDGQTLFGISKTLPAAGYESNGGIAWVRYDPRKYVRGADTGAVNANSIVAGKTRCGDQDYVLLADAADGLVKRIFRKAATAPDLEVWFPGAGTPDAAVASHACLEQGLAFANAAGLWKYDPLKGEAEKLHDLAGLPAPTSMASLGATLFLLIGEDIHMIGPRPGPVTRLANNSGIIPRFLGGDGSVLVITGYGGVAMAEFRSGDVSVRNPAARGRPIFGDRKAGLYIVGTGKDTRVFGLDGRRIGVEKTRR